MGWLGADLGAIIEGDKNGSFVFPVCTRGYNGDASRAAAIGGVTLFLEGAQKVHVEGFPSTIHIDGVSGGKWVINLQELG